MKKLSNPDLHDLPLELRLKVLKEVSKKFKKHFVLCPGFDIKTKEQLVKKFNFLKHHLGSYRLGGLNGIDGLMIKAYSGVYELDGKTMTWCLEENTPVLLGDGSFKRIKDLRVGDIVIDSNFMPTKVEAIRYTTDTVYSIQLPYIKEILANKDHRFLVIENFRVERRRLAWRRSWYRSQNREDDTPFMNVNIKWKTVEQLTENDAFLLPVPPDVVDSKQFDVDFYRLLGFYVAEGCIDITNNTAHLTQNDRTVIEFYYNIAKKYFKVSPKIYEHQYDVNCFGKRFKKYIRYEFYISPRHKSFFIQFGLGAQNKRIPYWIYLLPKECIKQFILGLLDGDGSVNNRNYELGTSSISLAYGLALLLTKFNMTAGIHTDKNRSLYTVYWSKAKFDNPDNQRQCQPSYRIGNFVAIPIIKIGKLAKERNVVDIQTSSGTFLCPVITHNCKLKYSYEADTIVLEVHKVKNKNVYNYTVGYGIPQDKKDLFTPIKELNGKWYGVLGKTFNTEIKAEVGQILNIAATEYKKEKVNSKIRYTLFQSRVITLKPNKKEPDSYLVIDRMSVEKAQSFYEALLKADDLGQITSPHGDPLPWPVSTEPTKPSKEKPKYVYRCEKCDYTIDSDEELPNNLICPICGGKLQRVKADKINSYTIINRAPLCELLISKGGIEMKKEIQLPQGMGSKSLLDRVLEKILGVDVFGQTRLDIQIPFYKVALYSKGLKNAVKEKEVKIINLKYNETYVPATYELLEVGRDTKERLLVSGFIIVKDTVPLVIHFYPAFDCQKLVIYGRDKDYSFIDSFVKDIHRFVNNNNPWKNEKITPFGKFLPLSSIDSNKIILDKSTLQKLNDTVFSFFNHKEKYEKANIPFKRGVIFSGVPGTGKTLSGKIIMNTVKNATFIWVTATDFMHLKTSYLFDMARELQPSILFIEDIDRCLQGPTLDTIKTQMDGLVPNEGILTILTTNFPERLPKTLIDRPGRFDDIIEFKLPDAVLRFKILWRYSENIDIENKKKSLACIARISEGLTPAHLKEVIVRSFLLSNGKKVTLELLKQSLREIKNLHEKFSFNKSFDKEISGYPYILKTIKNLAARLKS